MIVRILNISKNKVNILNNVVDVQNRGYCFRVMFDNGTHKDYSFKSYDFFIERTYTKATRAEIAYS